MLQRYLNFRKLMVGLQKYKNRTLIKNNDVYTKKVISTDDELLNNLFNNGDMDSVYSNYDKVASNLGITFEKFSKEDLLTGINIELEHGTVNEKTNVTNDDLIMTTKIALAHLNEFNDYYNKEYGLPNFEEKLKNRKRNIRYS